MACDLRYAWRDVDVGLAWRYVDSTVDNSRFFKTIDVTIPHKDYFDVDASYTIDDGWFDGLTIRAGVENLTDEPPPIYSAWLRLRIPTRRSSMYWAGATTSHWRCTSDLRATRIKSASASPSY